MQNEILHPRHLQPNCSRIGLLYDVGLFRSMDMTYPNAALTAVCELLLDDFELSQSDVENLAKDLADEFEAMVDNRNETAYMRHQESIMENGGYDDSSYSKNMIDAGRGHLLKG